MAASTPALQFSIQMPRADGATDWLDKVRRAEDIGAYSISVPDHLGPSLPQLAPMVALAAAATATTRVRLATTVLDNDFRHPVMIAKEVATLDVLSGGRVDLGMGAGWLEQDYTSTGIASWDRAGIRVDRLIESLDVLEALFAGGPVTHHGTHYDLEAFSSNPRPVQRPIPLMIGAGGKRMLQMAARRGAIVSILVKAAVSGDRRLAAFEEQLDWIAQARGDRDDLRVGVRVFFGEVGRAGQSRRSVAERVAAAHGMDVDDVLSSPFAMVGDPAAIADHLRGIADRYGVTYFTLNEDLAFAAPSVIEELSA